MTVLRIELTNYGRDEEQRFSDHISVEDMEGDVHMTVPMEAGDVILYPSEARALAAVLNAQADAAERGA